MIHLFDQQYVSQSTNLVTRRGSQTPRPFQVAIVEAVLGATDPFGEHGLNRVMYAAATGTGKTTTFSELILRLLEDPDNRVLVLAHRIELISQAYKRIKDHCQLHSGEIGMEIAETHSSVGNRVIVGSVQTCSPKRPSPAWRPTHIIVDEVHHAASPSYRAIATRYGVNEGKCIYVGCTATPERTDGFSLFAEDVKGNPVEIIQKGKPPRPATHDDSVFQRLVYEYKTTDAMADGWLVDGKVFTVKTKTSLAGVKTRSGDFAQDELQKRVDNAERTIEVINAWKRDLPHRPPTLAFCAGVEHSEHSAELARQAGLVAEHIDGTTDSYLRKKVLERFLAGEVDWLCNYGVFTEGTDLPNCACIVNLRPTKSRPLYQQMQGRGLRPLPKVIDHLGDAEPQERIDAILASKKPWCAILDVVDIHAKHSRVVNAGAVLALPEDLEFEGHSLLDAKKMLDRFKEVKDRVIGECPVTYRELEARLEQVDVMRRSGAKSEPEWKVTENGTYRYTKVPPQCHVELLPTPEGYRLVVDAYGERLKDVEKTIDAPIAGYLDGARDCALRNIERKRGEGVLMSFGVHKGKLIKDLPDKYLRNLVGWAVEQNLQYKLKGFNAVKAELARRKGASNG